MISKPTVLVLGAGASQPYGFPVGRELAETVCKEFVANGEPGKHFRNTPFSEELLDTFRDEPGVTARLIQEFASAFRESACNSLDDFVQAVGNRRFLLLVKAAIICKLITSENRDALLAADSAKDWYTYLFQYLRTPQVDGFEGNQLKVITFNFDRSFERRLFLMIKGNYGLTDEQAAHVAQTIPVFHVHGSLGGCAWLGDGQLVPRDYTPTGSSEQKLKILSQIRLVHEELPDAAMQDAWKWLHAARSIIFLGFGYHELLLSRLKMDQPYEATVYGSVLGFSASERDRIAHRFRSGRLNLTFFENGLSFLRQIAAVLE